MSVINKVPYIVKVLKTLDGDELAALKDLIDGKEQPVFRSLINASDYITDDDEGVNHITLETGAEMLSGYLIFNDDYCVLISYSKNTQALQMWDIDLDSQTINMVQEYLDITELRSEMDDSEVSEEAEIRSVIADMLDDGTFPTELPSTTSASAGQALILDSDKEPQWASIPTELPDTIGASENDVLALNASLEPEWKTASGGGSSIYLHYLFRSMSHPIIYIYNTSATPVNLDYLDQKLNENTTISCFIKPVGYGKKPVLAVQGTGGVGFTIQHISQPINEAGVIEYTVISFSDTGNYTDTVTEL